MCNDFPQATLDRSRRRVRPRTLQQAGRHSARTLDNRHAPLPVDLGLNHGRRVLDRISVDEAPSEPLAGDLVGADPGESMDVRGRLASAAERESTDLAAANTPELAARKTLGRRRSVAAFVMLLVGACPFRVATSLPHDAKAWTRRLRKLDRYVAPVDAKH